MPLPKTHLLKTFSHLARADSRRKSRPDEQTRIEEKVRRRRMQRMARARLGVENAADREFDVVPSRLRRPGAVVLEIDDEDPIFEHLEHAVPMRTYGWPRDLPRAVGQ